MNVRRLAALRIKLAIRPDGSEINEMFFNLGKITHNDISYKKYFEIYSEMLADGVILIKDELLYNANEEKFTEFQHKSKSQTTPVSDN